MEVWRLKYNPNMLGSGWGWGPMWVLVPALSLGLYAQIRVRRTYRRYARRPSLAGVSAGEMARRLLDRAGLDHVALGTSGGPLSDHYDPRTRTLRLSGPGETSIAALGVAAHEVGHALQHARGYRPLALRAAVLPLSHFGSSLALPLAVGGLLFRAPALIQWGILTYALAVSFALVALPVELDASRRAVRLLTAGGFIRSPEELRGVRRVLSAAAWTYIAAAAVAALQLFSLILLGRRR